MSRKPILGAAAVLVLLSGCQTAGAVNCDDVRAAAARFPLSQLRALADKLGGISEADKARAEKCLATPRKPVARKRAAIPLPPERPKIELAGDVLDRALPPAVVLVPPAAVRPAVVIQPPKRSHMSWIDIGMHVLALLGGCVALYFAYMLGRKGLGWCVDKVKGWGTHGASDLAALRAEVDALKAQLGGKSPTPPAQ